MPSSISTRATSSAPSPSRPSEPAANLDRGDRADVGRVEDDAAAVGKAALHTPDRDVGARLARGLDRVDRAQLRVSAEAGGGLRRGAGAAAEQDHVAVQRDAAVAGAAARGGEDRARRPRCRRTRAALRPSRRRPRASRSGCRRCRRRAYRCRRPRCRPRRRRAGPDRADRATRLDAHDPAVPAGAREGGREGVAAAGRDVAQRDVAVSDRGDRHVAAGSAAGAAAGRLLPAGRVSAAGIDVARDHVPVVQRVQLDDAAVASEVARVGAGGVAAARRDRAHHGHVAAARRRGRLARAQADPAPVAAVPARAVAAARGQIAGHEDRRVAVAIVVARVDDDAAGVAAVLAVAAGARDGADRDRAVLREEVDAAGGTQHARDDRRLGAARGLTRTRLESDHAVARGAELEVRGVR